ncbi:response regulator transcription factor [Paenibacillus qinlingensis]|uniref:response regulator transcription factor n=1 Tax=Paenibacillus qinlingensis TaxID=1837343 RepID=UPI0015631A50|nr:response regulator [Paenibacillus qinlingensis]NQX60060.1 response regulator [Paenibacillus qinlingensis]
MFKVLLVDDEDWVIQSLRSSIVWEDYGFQIVGEANNADEALKFIEENKPNLVFTDIKMPGMNGLELMKRAASKVEDIQFVVASGHAEFVYAQKAMQYGAIGYCLKPFEENEIRDCLVKTKRKLEASKKNDHTALIDVIFGQSESDYREVNRLLYQAGVHLEQNGLAIIQIVGQFLSPLEPAIPYCSLKTGPSKRVFLINQTDFHLFIPYIESLNDVSFGYVTNITHLQDIREGLKAAHVSAFHFFITGRKDGYEKRPMSDDVRSQLSVIAAAIGKRDLKLIDSSFQEMTNCLQTMQVTIKDAYMVYTQIIFLMNDRLSLYVDYGIEHFEQLAYVFSHVGPMLDELRTQMKQHLISLSTISYEEIGHQTIRGVAKFVAENFYKDINVNEISKLFYVTPNYVSYLFKKEMGINLTEYITKLRIDYAGNLLLSSDMTIQEISEKSGFNDYFYFTKIFKKMIGLTPSDYRKRSK